MRPYVAKTRSLVSLAFPITKPSKDQVALLAETFMAEALEDGSAIQDAFRQLYEHDLAQILTEELKLFPQSPISMELKRAMRKHFKRMAQKVAKEILVSD